MGLELDDLEVITGDGVIGKHVCETKENRSRSSG